MVAQVAKVFGSVDSELLRPRTTANFTMMKLVPGEIVDISGRCHTEFLGSNNWASPLPCPLYPATFATVGCECLSTSSTISLVFRVTSPLLYDACVSGLGDRCCLGRPPLPSQLTVLLLAYSTRTPPNFDAQTTDSCIGHCQGKSIQTSSKHLGERFPIWMVACCLDSLCVGEDHAGVSWFPARLVNGSRENSGMFALHLSPDFRHCVNEEFKPTLTTMPLLSRLCILTARGTL